MSVVINEFEVIAEPPPELAPQQQPAGGTPPPSDRSVRAADILNMIERQQQRLARLFAD